MIWASMHETRDANRSCHVVLLAGSRPGPDPLLVGSGVSSKALLPVAGKPMLAHVLDALGKHSAIKGIMVLAQDTAALSSSVQIAPDWTVPISWKTSGEGISRSIALAIEEGVPWPILVTTADNVLLTPSMIDGFLDGAIGADVAVGMVERRVLHARYPQNRRTWLKFRAGWWSGANLFWLGSAKVMPLLALWASVEADRKKGMRIVGAFGPLLLTGVLLRLLTIHRAMHIISRRFGLTAQVVPMRDPEACIDVDKPTDLVLAEEILAYRSGEHIPFRPRD